MRYAFSFGAILLMWIAMLIVVGAGRADALFVYSTTLLVTLFIFLFVFRGRA